MMSGFMPGILAANVGVPMLVLLWPLHLMALLPAALLAAGIGRRYLDLPRSRVLQVAMAGKLLSTLITLPLVWALLLALEIGVMAGLSVLGGSNSAAWLRQASFPLRSAWLAPTNDAWLIYLAFVVLAVPCCLACVFTEMAVARRMLAAAQPQALRAWIRRANLLSYLLLLIVAAAFPLLTHGTAW